MLVTMSNLLSRTLATGNTEKPPATSEYKTVDIISEIHVSVTFNLFAKLFPGVWPTFLAMLLIIRYLLTFRNK